MVEEDENARLLKHQQKLMQMTAEVLNTPPKSALKSVTLNPPLEDRTESSATKNPTTSTVPPPPARVVPDNVEVKVLISIGINTDISNIHSIVLKEQLNVPVKELEAIKPILQNASGKINNNSLITSVIENVKNKKKN